MGLVSAVKLQRCVLDCWQVARLLSDTSVPQFYPTLFVLVTDVMDTVGNLVWNRIKKKAETDENGDVVCALPGTLSAIDVHVDFE